jgi:HlyD family secretion protein
MPMKTRSRIGILALGAFALAAGLALAYRSRSTAPHFTTATVDRGEIADVVGATGVLQAVTTVQVGSQVSGTIKDLYADFNSNVKKGQVIARLDPSTFEARVAQARANVMAARAQVDRSSAAINDAKQKYDRARELAAQQLLPQSDLETAKATYDGALAGHEADKAAVNQAEASLNQALVDLAHTVIATPIDGVVLARNVDVGQTVAASFTAPVLFVIANDLTHMQVNASIDEADIGRVKAGQGVTFRVDAYPEQSFAGTVDQVRLQPVSLQNVVTYNTIITVDNKDLKLMPGMTATVSVIIESRENALRLPSPALRFRPEGFEERRASRAGAEAPAGGASGGSPTASAGGGNAPGAPGGAGAGGGSEGGRRRRGAGGPAADAPGGATAPSAGAASDPAGGRAPSAGRPGLVFLAAPDGKPTPTRIRLGISDGRFVEVVSGLEEGAQVITGDDSARPRGASASPSPGASNPFAPGRPQFRAR